MSSATSHERRRPNFSTREIAVLLETAKAYPILTAKHRDANTNSRKNAAYEAISRAVSAVGVARRSADEVRKKLTTVQSEVKSKAAFIAKKRHRTGGGSASWTHSQRISGAMMPSVSYEGVEGGVNTGSDRPHENSKEWMGDSDLYHQ